MGDVVDLFSGQPVPAAEGSNFVQEFSDGPLGDFIFAVNELMKSEDEATFREYMQEIRDLVSQWPT